MTAPTSSEFHAYLRSLSGPQFEDYVVDLLAAAGFRDLRRNVIVGGQQLDVVAVKHNPPLGPVNVYCEIKHVDLLKLDAIHSLVLWMHQLRGADPRGQFLVTASGRMSAHAQEVAKNAGLEVLDSLGLWQLAKSAGVQLGGGPRPPTDARAKGKALLTALGGIASGDADALRYQKWVADVLEYLFVPPLGPVHYEDADEPRRNRRDLILDNWAPDGFWAQLRLSYAADQVVVDAKNYTDMIKKRSIIELSHYLKPHGCGLFGMILCRMGSSPAARHAVREEWIGSRKMILVVDDPLIIAMLDLKNDGGQAESILRDRIAAFRKSL